MSYNIIDTELIEINPDLELQILKVGLNQNHTVLIIDDFLKNPYDLLSILKKYPIEKNSSHWWGHQLPKDLEFLKIRNSFNFLAREYYNIIHVNNVLDNIALQFNLVPGNKEAWNSNMVPHIDQAFVAGSIFLNENSECRGGTGFYKHKKSNIDYELSYVDETFKETAHYWAINETYKSIKEHDHILTFDSKKIDPEEWELQYIIESRFNRFIMHPSYIFHAPYIEKDWYLNEERVSLAIFLT